MEPTLAEQQRFPRLRGLGRLLWALVWLAVALAMLTAGLCGLNFIAVGLLSFFVDLGELGPSFAGEPVQTIGGKIAFMLASAAMVTASGVFVRLASRQRYIAAIVVCAVLIGVLWVMKLSGIHGFAGGIGRVG